jgi:hypothetical protein
LNYSNLPPPRPKPHWIGAPITVAVVVSAFAGWMCDVHREQGLFDGERVAMWFGLVVCLGCLLLASVNLVRELRAYPANMATAVCAAGIILGLVLIYPAMRACSEVYLH